METATKCYKSIAINNNNKHKTMVLNLYISVELLKTIRKSIQATSLQTKTIDNKHRDNGHRDWTEVLE